MNGERKTPLWLRYHGGVCYSKNEGRVPRFVQTLRRETHLLAEMRECRFLDWHQPQDLDFGLDYCADVNSCLKKSFSNLTVPSTLS